MTVTKINTSKRANWGRRRTICKQTRYFISQMSETSGNFREPRSQNFGLVTNKEGILSLVHTSHRLQQLLQRARLLRRIGNFSIFTATDCNSRWWQQICSQSEQAFRCYPYQPTTQTFSWKQRLGIRFFNGPTPAFFYIFVFSTNKEYNFTTNQCPFGIRCWDQNPRRSEHESPPITTRPGLPPKTRNK